MPIIYYKSDFARNKDDESIVYKFVTGEVVKVTLSKFLEENPDKTKEDFIKLKKFSNEDYHVEMLEDKKEIRYTTYIEDIVEGELIDDANDPCELICSTEDKISFKENVKKFLKNSKVTKTELRRFKLCYFKELSYVEVAQIEGTSEQAVCQSVTNFKKKAKFFLEMP